MLYRFADYTLDTQRYELWHAGTLRSVEPQVFDILTYLLAHRDHVVTRQELLEHVWPGRFVSETTLDHRLMQARQVIGDSGQRQRCIKTLRGRGYRFVAAVQEAAETPVRETPAMASAPAVPLWRGEGSGPEEADPVPAVRAAALHVSTLAPAVAAPLALPAMAGERKQVTVLCCTLADAKTVVARPGSAVMSGLVQTLGAVAQPVIAQFEGTIIPYGDSGFLALFGAPVAHEDHAWRAVLAASTLQQRLAAPDAMHSLPPGASLAAGIGLHTGLMVIGWRRGTSPCLDTAGEGTTAVAMALCTLAAPGTILLSATTQRLVQEEVQVESYGATAVDGSVEPVPVYAMRAIVRQHAGVPGRGGRVLSRFVGRQRELALLHERLAHAACGHGQVIGIVGEPGIGKSRLLNEFRQSLRGMAVAYDAAHCFSYATATPYLPVRDLLRHICGLVDTDSRAAMTAKISWVLQAADLDPEAGTPVLLQLLDVPGATERLAWLSPPARRAQTFALLWQMLLHRSQQHPLILAVENLQWLDTTSEAWLTGLVERLAGAAILLLVTYRPEYRLPWLEHSTVTHMTLPPLLSEESLAMVRSVVRTAPLPEPLVHEILVKAGGNPFFLEELAWSVIDPGSPPAALPVPDTIQAVLAARIDRLAPEAKRLLQIAAVIGTVVPLPLLQAIAERPEDVVHRSLAHLQTVGFLYATRFYPTPEYAFKHMLTHEVVYGSLLAERWRVLHAQIVNAIEQLTPDRLDAQVERLAYHAFRGEVWDKAVSYCWQAGAKAAERFALRDAAVAFEQALVALQHLPASRATRQQAIDLRFDLRNVLHPLGAFARILDHLRQAEPLAEALGDQRRRGQIADFMASCLLHLDAYDGALASAQRALVLATTLEDVGLQVSANTRLGEIYWALSDYRRAAAVYRSNVETLHGGLLRERFGTAAVQAVLCRAFLAMCLAELGAFAEGQAYGAEALRLAEAVEHSYSLALACVAIGHVCLRHGELAQAMQALERGLTLSEAAHLGPTARMCKVRLGTVYALAGRLPKALSLLEQMLAQTIAMRYTSSYPQYAICLGEGYVLAGRMAEARQLGQQALEAARAQKQQGWQAYALRLLGDIARDGEPPEATLAATFYRQALALAEPLDMRPLQAHCHLSLGTLYARTAQPGQADAALSTAMAFYRAMEMTFWLPQVEARLAQRRRVAT